MDGVAEMRLTDQRASVGKSTPKDDREQRNEQQRAVHHWKEKPRRSGERLKEGEEVADFELEDGCCQTSLCTG